MYGSLLNGRRRARLQARWQMLTNRGGGAKVKTEQRQGARPVVLIESRQRGHLASSIGKGFPHLAIKQKAFVLLQLQHLVSSDTICPYLHHHLLRYMVVFTMTQGRRSRLSHPSSKRPCIFRSRVTKCARSGLYLFDRYNHVCSVTTIVIYAYAASHRTGFPTPAVMLLSSRWPNCP